MAAAPPLTDERCLMTAILAAPADDAPRLIYADWLRDVGKWDRAEFIQIQCEIARDHDRVSNLKRWEFLRRRERELLENHWKEWAPEWVNCCVNIAASPLRDDEPGCSFRRGFVASIACTTAAFMWAECRTCFGQGIITDHRPMTGGVHSVSRKCHDCDGEKRTPGLVDTIAGVCPIESVVLTDRQPWSYRIRGAMKYAWGREDESEHLSEPAGRLPPALFDTDAMLDSFDTREDAHECLSNVCVRLARTRAGLALTEG